MHIEKLEPEDTELYWEFMIIFDSDESGKMIDERGHLNQELYDWFKENTFNHAFAPAQSGTRKIVVYFIIDDPLDIQGFTVAFKMRWL